LLPVKYCMAAPKLSRGSARTSTWGAVGENRQFDEFDHLSTSDLR